MQARYKIAQNTFTAGDYSLAAERFGVLGDYQDSEAMRRKALYQQAAALLLDGKPDEARPDFRRSGRLQGFRGAGDRLRLSDRAERA